MEIMRHEYPVSYQIVIFLKRCIVNYKLLMRTIELMTEFDDRDHLPVDKASQSFDKVFSSYTKLIQLFIIYEQLCCKHWPLNFHSILLCWRNYLSKMIIFLIKDSSLLLLAEYRLVNT